MKIQNPSMANATVMMRYERDEDGRGVPRHCDGQGVVEVGERDAEMLLSTPGWRKARQPRPLEGQDGPQEPAQGDPGPEAAEEPEGAETGAEEPEGAEEEEGPDIEGIHRKADALALAEQYGVEGLDDSMRLVDMKAALDEAIYGGEE